LFDLYKIYCYTLCATCTTLHFSHDEFEHVYLTTGATGRETEVFVVATLLTWHLAIFYICEQCCVLCVLSNVWCGHNSRILHPLTTNWTRRSWCPSWRSACSDPWFCNGIILFTYMNFFMRNRLLTIQLSLSVQLHTEHRPFVDLY